MRNLALPFIFMQIKFPPMGPKLTIKKEKIDQGDITPVAARGAAKGNGVIYVLVIGVVLAIVAMWWLLSFCIRTFGSSFNGA